MTRAMASAVICTSSKGSVTTTTLSRRNPSPRFRLAGSESCSVFVTLVLTHMMFMARSQEADISIMYFVPRALTNLMLIDEMQSLAPLMDMQVWSRACVMCVHAV